VQRRRVLAARVRTGLAVASALVFALTGGAYALYSDVTAGITTTDVIAGGTGGEQNILLVGVDSRTDAKGDPLPPEIVRELRAGNDDVLNTDTIILLHLPEDGGPGVAFSIPRDSYVSIPDLGADKINAAYPAAKARAARELVEAGEVDRAAIDAEAARQGRTALIGAVEDLTGLTVDHYAEINLLGFYNLTRAVGGVEVCLNRAVDEPLSGAHFPAGRQTISGSDALSFVRQRHGLRLGDLSRIRRQQVFLAAIVDKVLSAGTLRDPERLAGLVEVAQQSLVLDEGWDVLKFAQRAAGLASGDIDFVTVPTKGQESNDRGDVVVVDSYDIRRFVEEKIDERAASAQAVAAEGPPSVQWVVDVRNASTAPGIASLVSDRMEALGYAGGDVGNTRLAITSKVRWSGPDDSGATAVAAQLGGMPVEHHGAVPEGHVEVVLGSDFSRSVLAAPLPPRPKRAAPDGASAGGASAGGTSAGGTSAGGITVGTVPCID
jgi:LCP family protein required for cell wall assembly